jgi:hypothetical protein
LELIEGFRKASDLKPGLLQGAWAVEEWGSCMVADCAHSFDKKDRFPGTETVNLCHRVSNIYQKLTLIFLLLQL